MKILVVNADCIFVNTSANLCHLAYLKGLCDAGHQVDLLCADSQYRKVDPNMTLPENVRCYSYPGVSLYEWASIKAGRNPADNVGAAPSAGSEPQKVSLPRRILQAAKKAALSLYGVHGIYSTFVRKASVFRGAWEYDYILSLSTPTASHLLAHRLLKSKRVAAKHWVQIWEDPWASDAYGFNGNSRVFEEEKRLLSLAEKICYVSPLTLRNQQKLFPESADKMFWQPLPFYYQSEEQIAHDCSHNRYGYFGAYYPAVRDLQPFYEAARETGVEVNICGDPAGLFAPTESIRIHPRLFLDELKPIEDSTNVLIFLCNRRGGQIPGKIYQYSATNKIILFIMDGTEEEQLVLKEYFGKFNRYIFCQNNKEDIIRAIQQIEANDLGDVQNIPLDAFDPKDTVNNILKAGS